MTQFANTLRCVGIKHACPLSLNLIDAIRHLSFYT